MAPVVAGVAAIAAIVGAGVQIYAARQQSKAQAAALEYNAAVARNSAIYNNALLKAQSDAALQASKVTQTNTAILNTNKKIVREQAQFDATRIRERNRRIRGAQRARFAKSGVRIEGTPQDVLFDTAVQGEMEALLSIYKGEVRVFGINAEIVNQINIAQTHQTRAQMFGVQRSLLSSEAGARSTLLNYQADTTRSNFFYDAVGIGLSGVSNAGSLLINR